MTPRRIHRILIAALVIALLCLAGYLAGKWAQPPTIATWTLGESNSIHDTPTDQLIEKQIRALTRLDPIQAAGVNFHHEAPWLYAIKTNDGWTLPGVNPSILTSGIFTVKIIAGTGTPTKGPRHQELDRAATEYATKYNQHTELMLLTM